MDVDKAFKENVIVGYGSYVAANFHIYDDKTKVGIGKYTSIASGTHFVLGGNHRKDFVSQYPFNDPEVNKMYPDVPLSDISYDSSCGNIEVGSDVWIGKGVYVLSGTKIGDGAVIGAGSVVKGTVPPYAIVVGNPFKIIRYRFNFDQIIDLLMIRWWDWPVDKIKEAMPYVMSTDINKFIERYK